jgi:anaerobic ribonucleoside-triphosphate reductase activating protein
MNVARILYPVQVLGPGNRIGIWLCGCNRACKGCSNPELWTKRDEFEIDVANVASLIRKVAESNIVDGFTISGGEPFQQADELLLLLSYLTPISTDILIYTGYRLEELQELHSESVNGILDSIAVVVDGAYIEDLNDNSVLRGSSNQQIHILNPDHEDIYQKYLANTQNQIQNFNTVDGVVSVGIHRKTFTRHYSDNA